MGITVADFQVLGNLCVLIDKLKMAVSSGITASSANFRHLLLI